MPSSVSIEPKLPNEWVNRPPHSLLAEFMAIAAGLALVLVILYLLLGVAVDAVVRRIPPEKEAEFFSSWEGILPSVEPRFLPANMRAQAIVDSMIARTEILPTSLRVLIIDSDDENAFALPGGTILITRSLVLAADSENELAMILAHEIGHFVLRDHLRSMGRELVVLFLSFAILGNQPEARGLVDIPLHLSATRYSRFQESEADRIGLRLLNAMYGHVGGATDFFARMENLQPSNPEMEFLLTHPVTSKRISEIGNQIEYMGYATQPDRLPPLRRFLEGNAK